MADKEEVDLAGGQLVEAFVQRIEINPDAKAGGVLVHVDLHSVFASTRVLGGEGNQWYKQKAARRCTTGGEARHLTLGGAHIC